MAGKRADHDHVRKPFVLRQTEGNVEGHPVPDQKKTVDQVGVPAQFPALAASSAGWRTTSGRNAAATAAIPASPRRETIASI